MRNLPRQGGTNQSVRRFYITTPMRQPKKTAVALLPLGFLRYVDQAARVPIQVPGEATGLEQRLEIEFGIRR